MQVTEKDRVCIPVPLHEGFGMVLGNLACLTRGATIVFPEGTCEPLAVLETVEQERCTALLGLPTMFIAQLSHPSLREFNLGSLRTGIMAGAPCPVEVVRQVMERMHLPELTIAYGTSLTGAGVCQTSTGMPAVLRMTTVGVAQPHQEIRIVDPDTGAVLPIGTAGEACVRGYSLMLRYWGEPHRTVEAIDADGWVRTGDLAVMDVQGFVRVLGRIADTVVLDGQTVYPRELEEFLHRHPAVADVQVLGLSADGGEPQLCACIVLKPGQHTTDEGIRSFCRGRMAPFKVPRQVCFFERFPMTLAGKVRKNALREMVKQQCREAEAQPA
jgi:fatty-acyl-CoA synthase